MIDKSAIRKVAHLSKAQQGILFQALQLPHQSIYVEQCRFFIHLPLTTTMLGEVS